MDGTYALDMLGKWFGGNEMSGEGQKTEAVGKQTEEALSTAMHKERKPEETVSQNQAWQQRIGERAAMGRECRRWREADLSRSELARTPGWQRRERQDRRDGHDPAARQGALVEISRLESAI